ncbi:BioY family transporter [Salipaludibacillus neizhouensis]|uniref:Biotin transporter n=1 Tax=Salipaludibacillus neizhouensis TaxID=885475 RepID=A0A3A9K2J4_9BACI|nr:biotin transporter BioY [Salipaludibacillus neizhouensis]RKL65438.1 BioY family transporter [Salipaludibacillus neizhouensis]
MNNKKFTATDLTKGAIFIALMAIGANLTAIITIGTVPLTFQTVVAILAGILLGKRLAAFAMTGYLMLGLIGVPVFAGFVGGFHTVTSPTFGFLLSFIALAYIVGLIIELNQQPSLFTFYLSSYVGLILNYLIGVPYLYLHSHFILGLTDVQFIPIAVSMVPFFLKDFVLVGFAATLAPKLLKAINKSSPKKPVAS